MFFPNQPLYIHPPPTKLLSIDHLIARLAHSNLGLNLALSLPFASNQRSTPQQYPLFIPHSVFSSPVRFIHAFVLTLAQDSIVLLIYYLNEVLGIFSHDQRPRHVGKLHARESEALQTPTLDGSAGRSKKAEGRNVDMYGKLSGWPSHEPEVRAV